MSDQNSDINSKVKRAAALKATNQNLTIPQAMGAVFFSIEQSSDRALQMRVRRYGKKLQITSSASVPSTVATTTSVARNTTAVSPLSGSLSNPSTASPLLPQSSATSSTTSTSSMSTNNHSTKKRKVEGVARIRKTASQVQTHRTNQKKIDENKTKAVKSATKMYAAEKSKDDGMSAQKVCDLVNHQFGTNLDKRHIQHLVKRGMINETPPKPGPNGGIDHENLKILLGAFESYVQIKQVNGESTRLSRVKLAQVVNQTMVLPGDLPRSTDRILNRCLRETGIDLKANVIAPLEDRRKRWTTYNNLKLWFDIWEKSLVELGFAERNEGDEGGVSISNEQLARIVNLDESCLSLDGSHGARGGRPAVLFYNPDLPKPAACASKSSTTATFISGSNALGEALPPHFQFSTTAKIEERHKVRSDMFEHMQLTQGTFGHAEPMLFPVSVGVNDKGGMDDKEFESYLLNMMHCLYPDASDTPGKRVMIKLDSGPGRSNVDLLARLRLKGYLLYPGVPNTTAVTQETDQNYGLFKSIYRTNLLKMANDREEAGLSTSLNMSVVGLLIFGGTDRDTKEQYRNAFAESFSKEKCIHSWQKVGAAPLTRACLRDSKVRHDGGLKDTEDPMFVSLQAMQAKNNFCVQVLNMKGYNGNRIRATLKEQAGVQPKLTVPNSQERIKALVKATTHGDRFYVTGGCHLNSDDVFKAAEVGNRKREHEELEKDKKQRLDQEQREKEAFRVISLEKSTAKLNMKELEKLLYWYRIPKSKMGNLQRRREQWEEIKQTNRAPPTFRKWTSEEEVKLVQLTATDIPLEETALGRMKAQRTAEFEATFASMPKEKQKEYIDKLLKKQKESS